MDLDRMYAQNEDPFDRRRLHLLARILRKTRWMILWASLTASTIVFVVLVFSASRYESGALVRGWLVAGTDIVTGTSVVVGTSDFVSPAELEVRINSPDLLRKAKENYKARPHQGNLGDLVDPAISVSWVPSSELLSFTATASSPEAAQGILFEALPILLQSENRDGQAAVVARQRMAELEYSMGGLRAVAAKLVAEQEHEEDNPIISALLSQLRLASLRLVFADMQSIESERASIALTTYQPTSADIVQLPTLSDSRLPSRSVWVALLAGVFVMLAGFAAAILVSAFSDPKQNDERWQSI